MVAPPIVKWLGYGGLLPFVALAAVMFVDRHHSALWRDALVAYGAVILSFVGALHWGFAMSQSDMTTQQRTHSFVWSVVPSLIAWCALIFLLIFSLIAPAMYSKFASALLVVGFLIHFWQDSRLNKQVDLPVWYLPLRLRLSLVACVALLSSLFI